MYVQIEVQTRSKVDLVDITDKIKQALADTEVQTGVCFIFCPHTTAGIVLNENWDPAVEKDIAMVLEHITPESLSYSHREGNAPAHVKAVLVGSDHFIFVQDGELQMGQWQGIFFAEFDGPRRRKIWVRVQEVVN
jgi:secondary thiamine-phosphate synthase enzyme